MNKVADACSLLNQENFQLNIFLLSCFEKQIQHPCTTTMKLFVTIFNGWKQLIIDSKDSILDGGGILYSLMGKSRKLSIG